MSMHVGISMLGGGKRKTQFIEKVVFAGFLSSIIDHFTVSYLVAWPLNESEAGGDLLLIETFLLFSC